MKSLRSYKHTFWKTFQVGFYNGFLCWSWRCQHTVHMNIWMHFQKDNFLAIQIIYWLHLEPIVRIWLAWGNFGLSLMQNCFEAILVDLFATTIKKFIFLVIHSIFIVAQWKVLLQLVRCTINLYTIVDTKVSYDLTYIVSGDFESEKTTPFDLDLHFFYLPQIPNANGIWLLWIHIVKKIKFHVCWHKNQGSKQNITYTGQTSFSRHTQTNPNSV